MRKVVKDVRERQTREIFYKRNAAHVRAIQSGRQWREDPKDYGTASLSSCGKINVLPEGQCAFGRTHVT